MDPGQLEQGVQGHGQAVDFGEADEFFEANANHNDEHDDLNGPHGCLEWALCLICMLILAPFYCLYLFFAGIFNMATKGFVKYRNLVARSLLTRAPRKFDSSGRRESVALHKMTVASERANMQASSDFFKRMPAEIRELVYYHALGGQNFHILHGRKRMVGLPCIETYPLTREDRILAAKHRPNSKKLKERDAYCRNLPRRWDEPHNQFYFHFECVEPFIDRKTLLAKNEAYRPPMKGKTHNERLALLKSCKLVYNEAIDLFYSRNNFLFHHPQDLILFASTIPPSRLRSIRTIEFILSGSVPSKPRYTSQDVWNDVVPVLDQMAGLQSIRVVPSSRWEDGPLVLAMTRYETVQTQRSDGRAVKVRVEWLPGANSPMSNIQSEGGTAVVDPPNPHETEL